MIRQDAFTSVPAILDLEQALNDFRQKVEPLLLPEQEKEWDGVKLLLKEKAILLLGLRLVGHCIAILIFNLFTTNRVMQQATLQARGLQNVRYMNQGFLEVPITLIGGVELRVETLYKLARHYKKKPGPKRKRGKSEGQGFYPTQVLLGISDQISPLLRCLVTEVAVQLPSFEQARHLVGWLGLSFPASRIRHISTNFGQIGLQIRDQKLTQLKAGKLLASNRLAGKRLVVSVDGGRIRIRVPITRGRRRKSGRRGYKTEWKEPKLLVIYVLDEQGRKTKQPDCPFVCDGTLKGKEHFLEILRLYLHHLEISGASEIVLVADGAPWIWNNVPPLLIELRGHQITQVLDYYHACQQLYQAATVLLGDSEQAKAWARKWKKKLAQGQTQALLNEMASKISQPEVSELKVAQTKFNYFARHSQHRRLDYKRYRFHNLPMGSGVIESLIRQVVNLRLKSSGKLWELEVAEAFLHARCQWVTNNWNDFCEEVLKFGLVSLPTYLIGEEQEFSSVFK